MGPVSLIFLYQYVGDLSLVIIASANVIAPKGAKPSTVSAKLLM